MGKGGSEGKSGGLVIKAAGGVFALVLAPVIVAAILKYTGIQEGSSGGGEKEKGAKADPPRDPDPKPPDPKPPGPPAPLFAFNGKDLTGFHTVVKDKGKDKDPDKVFSVEGGQLRVSGQMLGYLVTDKVFTNYRLVLEYRWGEKTWPPGENKARASSVCIHASGPDGAGHGRMETDFGGYFILIKEGVNGRLSKKVGLMATYEVNAREQAEGKGPDRFTPGGKRILQQPEWPGYLHPAGYEQWGRGADGKKIMAKRDVKGYRGKADVEKPAGQWNVLEITADLQKFEVELNGKLINRALSPSLTRGKVFINSLNAEIVFRKFEIHPLRAG